MERKKSISVILPNILLSDEELIIKLSFYSCKREHKELDFKFVHCGWFYYKFDCTKNEYKLSKQEFLQAEGDIENIGNVSE